MFETAAMLINRFSVVGILMVTALLAGCQERADDQASGQHGRYIGIGTYSVGELWSKMAQQGKSDNAASATTADDEHVIVVVDSQTGEIRECGDYSGRCVSMKPWTKGIAPEQATPVKLLKHASDLAADAEQAEANKAEASPRP